ncbi:alanine--tRNA ligase [Sanyastnella coralliicola]|uniref:alanine--tRNA ligase n=1 Tax=Sanyastnella coralliicola TaxID=3069118 RepID=UPI0027B8DAD7|nr:alanine--tRNA ligase [Longitalea sp. SCSIO 12813]
MESAKIRKVFFDFFASKGHEIVASAPMVVKDDPTLMFTNAGMNQFKDLFLGNSVVKDPRVANTQKCLRVSGKHNDLEEVGVDTYHHTMFEMLGNWSFGDYFKKDAIEWAWELLTEHYKLDKDRLYVTYFEGDKEDALPADEEAVSYWKPLIDEDRIIACDKKDNFWEMGETGPCGPCSEIHIDLRSDADRAATPGKELVNQDHPQVIEIWNLVFMEFNRMADRSLKPLPNKHIDTGMGLERLAMALQDKTSNYDTDVFQYYINEIEKKSGKKYQQSDSKQDVAMRVISDHLRAVSFSIADGQLPSNSGAGYVIRRILRRAIRYAFSFLDIKEAFIYELSAKLVEHMGEFFPELEKNKDLIAKVIKEEEEGFLRTLDKGIQRLEELFANSGDTLDGKSAFELYDTYGFPIDLTALIASERGVSIDESAFDAELQKQKERSRAAGKVETDDWVILHEDEREEFIGYDRTQSHVKITRYRRVKQKGKDRFQLAFNITPFYAESGGQVGDTGKIVAGDEEVYIMDTKKENNLIVHFTEKLPSNPKVEFEAFVNEKRRTSTARNHSATHLLHEALREVLGTHVEQKGSLVHPDHLRFDFSHFAKVSDEEVERVEAIVNQRILENIELDERRNVPIDEAKDLGAMMLFGEKYGDLVRVIKFGSSVELCGGIHVPATGSIGYFKIHHETAVAAGVRRIEAYTGQKASDYLNKQLSTLAELKEVLKNPKDMVKAVNDLVSKNNELSKKLEQHEKQKAGGVKKELAGKITENQGINFLAEKVDLAAAEIKDIAFQLRAEYERLFAVLGSDVDGKTTLTVFISDDLVKDKGMNAGQIIRELAKEIQGGGGGQPFFATAGGKNPDGIGEALKKAENFL